MSFYNSPKVLESRVTPAESTADEIPTAEVDKPTHHSSLPGVIGRVAKSVVSALPVIGPLVQALDSTPFDPTQMKQDNLEMIQMQMQIQQISQQFTTQSNSLKADHDARMNTIRNFH